MAVKIYNRIITSFTIVVKSKKENPQHRKLNYTSIRKEKKANETCYRTQGIDSTGIYPIPMSKKLTVVCVKANETSMKY
jgi:hypothetical protein